MTVGRYIRTLRHLRPVQVYGRLPALLGRGSSLDSRPPPPLRPRCGDWVVPISRRPGLIAPWRFRFLNREIDAGSSWDDPSWPRLWRYHLHYHDDLMRFDEPGCAQWQAALIRRWIDANPGPAGTGWEPYPLSLRLVNWVKWLCAGHEPAADMLHSMAVQARHLARRTETHLLGNHLFENAKALVFAGAFFASEEADAWLQQGLRLAHAESIEQVLPDGGHFERSPMYHARILEGVLDLIGVAQTFRDAAALRAGHDRQNMAGTAYRMFQWLGAMTHPDGEIALLNDSAFDVAPRPDELVRYAQRLGLAVPETSSERLVRLPSTGYYRACGAHAVAICDAAPLGPDYLPAHGHADTFTFELSLRGQRVIVDSGVSTYEAGAERSRQRGTPAHNTVTIDGFDSSEVWASFRVGRRARVFDVQADESGGAVVVGAKHDGYRFLPGRPLHRRQWRLLDGSLEIDDTISGAGPHRASARLHFHPALRVSRVSDRDFEVSDPAGNALAVIKTDAATASELKPARYHPEFGISLENCVLESVWHGELPCRIATHIVWPQ